MTPADRLFRAAGACLLALSALSALLSASAQAQVVTNVAAARWSVGGRDFSVESNRVTFHRAARPARLSTFIPSPDAGESIVLASSYCSSPGQTAVSRVGGAPAYQIVAIGKDEQTGDELAMVQWLRFNPAVVQMFGIARLDQWEKVLPHMRAVRDGFGTR